MPVFRACFGWSEEAIVHYSVVARVEADSEEQAVVLFPDMNKWIDDGEWDMKEIQTLGEWTVDSISTTDIIMEDENNA